MNYKHNREINLSLLSLYGDDTKMNDFIDKGGTYV